MTHRRNSYFLPKNYSRKHILTTHILFQNKQSPVEELLRQADQLIATQRPRAEVYAAMAESLGRAWRDINSTLELRKVSSSN